MRRLMVLLFLTGCVNPSGESFVRSDETSKALDVHYCKTYASTQGYTAWGGLAGALDYAQKQQGAFDLCMMDRGYRPSLEEPHQQSRPEPQISP